MKNSKKKSRNLKFKIPAYVLMAATAALAAQGPSSSETPYLLPSSPSVEFTSILTVGDAVKKNVANDTTYRMVGIPDGLGVVDNDDGTFTLVMNHELGNTVGIVRAHGGKGAFVSKWKIRKSDLKVLRGEDLMKSVFLYDTTTSTWIPSTNAAFGRFCSGDMAKSTALYNSATDKGYFDGRIYMNGEENGPTGRAMAHIVTGPLAGSSFEVPALGKASWENELISPYPQDKTVVMSNDDTSPGKVFIYIGTKNQLSGPIASGLHEGVQGAIAVAGKPLELRDSVIAAGTRFSVVAKSDTTATKFLRPEDGAWDTQNPNRYYFVTTDRYDQVKDGVGATVARSRLYRLTFDSITNPQTGGTVEVLLDGTEAGQMYDNITVDAAGNVILVEDVGNQAHNGKIWNYNPTSDVLTLLGKHDSSRFGDVGVAAASGYNQDEEASGVIDVSDLFTGVAGYDTNLNRYYLLVDQAHYALPLDPELAEKGQLLLMKVAK